MVFWPFMMEIKISSITSFSTEKRAKFDQGEDPLDPDQQGGGGWPFQGGGFPFGNGGNGYQFKFHFN